MEVRKLCTPAMIYFLVSIFSFLMMLFQNMGSKTRFNLGSYSCPCSESGSYLILIFKVIYMLFVTIVLDSLCKNGYKALSWFLVLLPLLIFFTLLGLFMVNQQATMVLITEEEYM
jgi:hypothetical protein